MLRAIFVEPWPWWAAGAAIGMIVVFLAALASRPLSVTTGFGTACALTSRLPYFQRDEFGARGRWRLEFLGAIVAGAALSAILAGRFHAADAMGSLAPLLGTPARVALLFLGGVSIGFGSRLAGGCTSGHSIQGTALGATSSFVATAIFMAAGAAAVWAVHAALGIA